MAGLQYNFFPTDLLYPKSSSLVSASTSSSSSSSEAMNRASVTFQTHLKGNKKADQEDDHQPKISLIIQKAERSPLILKHQMININSSTHE